MQFRVRPASKRLNQTQLSLVQFPTSKPLTGGQSPLLPRSFISRIDHLQASISQMQDLHRRQRQIGNVGYLEVQKRLDKIEYKLFSTQQDLRQLNEIRQIKQPRENFVQIHSEPSKNQIMVIKQVLLQQKQAQKESIKHIHAQIQQMSLKMLRQEQETREILGNQRMQMENRLSGQGQQLREIQGLKQKKLQQQYQMMKGVVANAERKIVEELERKIRNQTVVKDFLQDKIASLKEEMSMQQRHTLASQTKFIKETKQSLQTLFALVNSFKKELSQELAQTQKLTTASIKKISMTLDIARQRSSDQIKQAVQMHEQVSNELVELKNYVTSKLEQNRQSINQFQQHTMEHMDQGANSSVTSSAGDGQRFMQFQKEMNHWKSLTQQKNLNVFKQISNTLKAMKIDWRKQNDDLVCQVAALNQSLKSLKKSGPSDLKKSVQALVSIFNNEFDVLAEELQTMTDMISLSKKENEKAFKENLIKLRGEINEEIKNIVNQKSKETSQYTDKSLSRSQENMKAYIQKELKFVSDGLSQKINNADNLLQQLQSALKKANLLTTSQLQEYSLKLKAFNDNYKQYLQQQRKEDMKKRMQLQQSMRKNANNLMDICYKKSQFLVQGLKKSIEVSQMKQKLEAAQALDNAKDELKKQVQGTRLQWQKQFSQGMQRLTKQRENSQQILHEAIQQSINNAKRNLGIQIGNNKLEIEQKINQMKVKQVQKQAEQQQQQLDLKNTIFQMLRDQKKLNQQSIQKTKHQIQVQRKQVQLLLSSQIKKIENFQKEQSNKAKTGLEQDLTGINKLTKDMAQQIEALKQAKSALQQDLNQYKLETKGKLAQLQDQSNKNNQEKVKGDQDFKGRENQLDKKIFGLSQNIQNNYKTLNEKIVQVNNKIVQNLSKIEKDKNSSINQEKTKQAEIMKKIIEINQVIQKKDIATNAKIEQISKKIIQAKLTSQHKDGEGKKVGEQSLNQLKIDLQKQISKLQARIDELQSKDKGEQNEESISAIRKSVNKLQAMSFSEQAKNKALFDRLAEDVNKLSENLASIANQIRQ